RRQSPLTAAEPRLLDELSLRCRERFLVRLPRSGRELQQVLARRLAELADERYLPLAVDSDDCDRAGMADDLPLVVAPALDVDADPPPLEDPPRLVRPHAADRFDRTSTAHPTRVRATLPAANAEAKNHGSSSGPRPMCSSGRPSHASRHSATSTSRRVTSQSGASRPAGQATATSPRQSSTTARVWWETPRWR